MTNSFFLARDAFTSWACRDEFANSRPKLAAQASDGHAEAITPWCHCRAWPTEVGPCRRRQIPSRRLVVFWKNYPFFFRKVGHFGLANLGVQGLYVLLAYASDVPGKFWRERAPPFSRGSTLQTRFCLGKQYCCNTRWKCPSRLSNVPGPNTRVWTLRETSGFRFAPPRLPQPRTNLKGGRRACRRPQVE